MVANYNLLDLECTVNFNSLNLVKFIAKKNRLIQKYIN